MSRVWSGILWLAIGLAAWSCGDPSPLAPDPVLQLTGTYTFEVEMSASCSYRLGARSFRADIHQSGRDLDVRLYEGAFISNRSTWSPNVDRFRGQDNPDAVLFFAAGGLSGDVLFTEMVAGVWEDGQARGRFQGDRIDALFNGKANGCKAPDHRWTFVRR